MNEPVFHTAATRAAAEREDAIAAHEKRWFTEKETIQRVMVAMGTSDGLQLPASLDDLRTVVRIAAEARDIEIEVHEMTAAEEQRWADAFNNAFGPKAPQ